MTDIKIGKIIPKWTDEISELFEKNNRIFIALFDYNNKLVYANEGMGSLFKGEKFRITNPSIKELRASSGAETFVYEGKLTFEQADSKTNSISSKVYLKNNEILVVGSPYNEEIHKEDELINNLNEQNEALKRRLKNIDETKSKFVSTIGHDLKSPFNSILGFSQILLEVTKNRDLDAIEKYAEMILESSNKTMDLLTNLLMWGQAYSGGLKLNKENFDIFDFIKDIAALYQETASKKSIVINRNLPNKQIINADKDMINTVFRNLISNAIKFSKPDNEINISATVSKKEIEFTIRDKGIGISKNDLNKLFQIDERFSTPGTNLEKGTGLGLVICKEYVELNSGKIWVESQEGKGSIFYLTLPIPDEKMQTNII